MHVERIGDIRSLHQLGVEWNERHCSTPMQSFLWMQAWWDAYQTPDGSRAGNELCVLAVRDHDDQLTGLAPFYADCSTGRFACLRLLGDGPVCSDHLTLLANREDRARVVEAVGHWLLTHVGTEWHQLVLESIHRDDESWNQLTKQFGSAGLLVERVEEEGSCHIELPESWDAYIGSLSKNHRKRCRRWWRSYFESGRAQVTVAKSALDLERCWPLLQQFHSERRHDLGETGAFESPAFDNFHREVAAGLLETNQLHLQLLEIDQAPCAVEYAFVDDTTCFAYQSGMSLSGADQGAGSLSLLAMIRHAIESGKKRFDFMRGQESYKSHWNVETVPTQTLSVRERSLRGFAQHWMAALYHNLKIAKLRVQATR